MANRPGISLSIDLKSMDKTLKKLQAIGANVANAGLRKALRAGAKVILKQAKINCPVDTGRLKKGLRVKAGKGKKFISYLVTTSHDANLYKGDLYYAGMVENGVPTRGIAPNPFMRRALDMKGPEAQRVILTTLQAYLKSAQALRGQVRNQAVEEVGEKLAAAASFDSMIKKRVKVRRASLDAQREKFEAKVSENLKTSRTVFAKEDKAFKERLERRNRNRKLKPI